MSCGGLGHSQNSFLTFPLRPTNIQDLHAEANVNVGNSGMPTFVNFFRSTAVDVLTSMGLTKGGRQMLSILGDRTEGISGVLKPVRNGMSALYPTLRAALPCCPKP